MPRLASSVNPAQEFAPPIFCHPSAGQVSYPSSPGSGMVWNVQRILPVCTS